jgi:hypothetical protein
VSGERGSLLGILRGLMVCENLGDVHDEINLLCDAIGIDRPEGDFNDGWTEDDWRRVKEERR